MEGCSLASELSTLCSAEVSLPSSGVGVASTLSSIAESAPSTWVLGGGGGLKRARELCHALHIITGRFNGPHTISINNAEHIVQTPTTPLRVPNPNSRGHATKRGLRVPSPNSRGHATKRGLRVPHLTLTKKNWFLKDRPTKGDKIRSGYLTPAFSRAQKRAEVLRHPCILRGPQRQARGKNQKWPTGGHIAYTHAFSVKLYCLRQGTSKRGEEQPFLSCHFLTIFELPFCNDF